MPIDGALDRFALCLKRIGLGKLSRLEPPQPANRYRALPGWRAACTSTSSGWPEISSRGAGHRVTGKRHRQTSNRRARRRGAPTGWEFVHVCVDDATRLAYAEVLADEMGTTAAGLPRRAVALYRRHGISRRACHVRQRRLLSLAPSHALACRTLGMRHLRTRPYRPRTNGKAERFIQHTHRAAGPTAPSTAPATSERQRSPAGSDPLQLHHRPHGSLGHQPPSSPPHRAEQRPG